MPSGKANRRIKSCKIFKKCFDYLNQYSKIILYVRAGERLPAERKGRNKMETQMIRSIVSEWEEKLKDIRHYLHENPELSFEEYETAEYIRKQLKDMGLRILDGFEGTSTVAVLEGNEPGPCVAFRADIDALPVQEENDLPYKSRKPGVMHACGHDTHTACLLCLADIFSSHRELVKGKIKFIFQAAEEKLPGGALGLCEAGVMDDVDMIFGFHCTSAYPVGTITVSPGADSAAIGIYEVKVKGYGGHGSAPHKAKNPVPVACMVGSALNQILAEKKDPASCGVFTVAYMNGGRYPNIITDEVTLGGNIRTLDNDLILQIFDQVRNISKGICEGMGCSCEVSTSIGYQATINVEKYVDVIKEAVKELGYVHEDKPVSFGGEDFSYYLLKKPGAYFHVGMADPENPVTFSPHHNGCFQLDERGLRVALEMELATYLKALEMIR